MRIFFIFVLIASCFVISNCSSSKKNSDGKNGQATTKKKIKNLVPGKMADMVQQVLPPGWENNYDFEKADLAGNYLQMIYQKKTPVDFYLFSADKKDFLIRVDWDCKSGDCSEGISAYKFEAGAKQEIYFRKLLAKKLTKKLSQKTSYCVGSGFQFGSMWSEGICELGFEFPKNGNDGAVYKSAIATKEIFKGPRDATLTWNPKKAIFE